MYKLFLYCLILFFSYTVIRVQYNRNVWNLIGNEIMIWHKYCTGLWHTGKISCWYATSNSLRSTEIEDIRNLYIKIIKTILFSEWHRKKN